MEYYVVFCVLAAFITALLVGAFAGFLVYKRKSAKRIDDRFGGAIKPLPQSPPFRVSLCKQACDLDGGDLSKLYEQEEGLVKGKHFGSDDLESSNRVPQRRVWLQVRYLAEYETLEVTLCALIAAPGSCLPPSSYVFFNLYLLPGDKNYVQTTSRQCTTTTTMFNETFQFPLARCNASSSVLRLSLLSIDVNRVRTCLGYAIQPLSGLEMVNGNVHDLRHDLAKLESCTMEGCVGEALVSLCYNMQKETLKISITNGRNLPATSYDRSTYCVQVEIVIGDQTVKIKRNNAQSRLQSALECSYAYQLPCKHLDACCLAFTVLQLTETTEPGEPPTRRERSWGKFTIGPCSFAKGAGVDHWKMMLNNGRKVIEMWHPIARAY